MVKIIVLYVFNYNNYDFPAQIILDVESLEPDNLSQTFEQIGLSRFQISGAKIFVLGEQLISDQIVGRMTADEPLMPDYIDYLSSMTLSKPSLEERILKLERNINKNTKFRVKGHQFHG